MDVLPCSQHGLGFALDGGVSLQYNYPQCRTGQQLSNARACCARRSWVLLPATRLDTPHAAVRVRIRLQADRHG